MEQRTVRYRDRMWIVHSQNTFKTLRNHIQNVLYSSTRRPTPHIRCTSRATVGILWTIPWDMVDILGRTCQEGDIEDAVSTLIFFKWRWWRISLDRWRNLGNLLHPSQKAVPILKRILWRAPSSGPRSRRTTPRNLSQPPNHQLPYNRAPLGNPDLAVLKAENQNVTHVTLSIAINSKPSQPLNCMTWHPLGLPVQLAKFESAAATFYCSRSRVLVDEILLRVLHFVSSKAATL